MTFRIFQLNTYHNNKMKLRNKYKEFLQIIKKEDI